MKRRLLLSAVALALVLELSACGAGAAEGPLKADMTLHVVATSAVERALEDLQPLMTHKAGVPVKIEFGQSSAIVEHIDGADLPPLVVLTKQGVDALQAKGYVRSRADLAESYLGLAVADDAPLPVMRTKADFVAFLQATPSIAYLSRGPSAAHMNQLIETLGLKDSVMPKVTLVEKGLAGTVLKEGHVAAAVQQISELRVAGASKIVPLPDDIQLKTIMTGAVLESEKASLAAAAQKVLAVLKSRQAVAAFEHAGVKPLAH